MKDRSDFKILQPSGILDGDQGTKFRQEVTDLIASGVTIILVDFQDVTFMDSSGLGALVIALKTVRAAGAKIFLCAISQQVKMLFELTSMNKVFKISQNRDEFMDKFEEIVK